MAKKKREQSHAQKMLKQQKVRQEINERASDAYTQAHRVDARQGMATTVFTVESLDMKTTKNVFREGKKMKGIGSNNAHKKGVSTTFAGEADYDVERRVRDARRQIGSQPKAFEEMIASADAMRAADAIEFMPTRPKWSEKDTKNRLRLRERKAFARWARRVKEKMVIKGGYPPAFEQNLEVWRQLWRAMERSDVICCVLDARNPMLHFPAALYAHVCRVHKKPLICVLNKIDVVPRESAEKWREHLLGALPGVDEVIGFIAVEGDFLDEFNKEPNEENEAEEEEEEEEDDDDDDDWGNANGEEITSDTVYEPTNGMTVGKSALVQAVKRVTKLGKRWKNAVEEDPQETESARNSRTKKKNYAFFEDDFDNFHGEDEEIKAECVVALVGHPNVGKSSMINTLLGRKAVSVKATPGHTKTLQTLRLGKGVWLCDSPGLVFPRVDASLPEQIVGGIVPLPTVREPYSSLRWLAEMREVCKERWKQYANSTTASDRDKMLAFDLAQSLPETLKISALPTDLYDNEILELRDASDVLDGFLPWSPLSIARETALKRKLLVSGGRPDDRAGGVIALKRVLDGKSPYAVPPPEGEVVIIKARKDSSWAPFDVSENVELEEGFEEELEEMNRNDNGFSAASAADNNAASGEDLVDYEQWTGDEDPCEVVTKKTTNLLVEEESDEEEEEEEEEIINIVRKKQTNAFAALSLDE